MTFKVGQKVLVEGVIVEVEDSDGEVYVDFRRAFPGDDYSQTEGYVLATTVTAPPEPPEVGDVVATASDIGTLPNGAIVLDGDDDAWQLRDGSWYCTRHDDSYYDLSAADMVQYGEFIVAYLPEAVE